MTAVVRRHSEYDNFLFAIVVESDDVPVTVVSMLSRLNLDPWLEAARLAKLPRSEAINSLSATIQKFRYQSLAASEADAIASKLIGCLPTREALVVQAMRQETLDFSSMWLIFAVFFVMMAITQNVPRSEKDAPTQSVAVQQNEPGVLHHDGVRKHNPHSVPPVHIQY